MLKIRHLLHVYVCERLSMLGLLEQVDRFVTDTRVVLTILR